MPVGEPVLLEATITREQLKRARAEIEHCVARGEPVTLIINSDGGAIDATLEFIEWLLDEKKNGKLKLAAKIYSASSAAAVIALVADHRSISQQGLFGLHVGSAIIEYSHVTRQGLLAEHLRILLRKFADLLFKLLGSRLPIAKLTTLHAKGTLILEPLECMEYGLCDEIF